MSAVISKCGNYRYQLHRRWQEGERRVLWVMLNPSTADAELDDPTIRRCIGFSKAWGYDTLAVGNLYGLRSTQPAALWAAAIDPVGPMNDTHLRAMAVDATLIVCAWGSNANATRARQVFDLLSEYLTPSCLEMTKGHQPRHPLYCRGSLKPAPMQPRTGIKPSAGNSDG